MFYQLYYLYGNNWITEEGKINEDNLANYMEKAKEIYAMIDERNEEYESGQKKDKSSKKKESEKKDFCSMKYSLIGGLTINNLYKADKPASIENGAISTPWDFASIVTIMNNKQDINYKILSRKEEKIFIPVNCIGINAKSENKEVAKKVVADLFKEKFQTPSSEWNIGLPVNKKAFVNFFEEYKKSCELDKTINRYVADPVSFIDEANNHQVDIRAIAPNEEEVNKLIEQIDELSVAAKVNKKLLSEAAKQFELYQKGEISKKDALKDITNKLNIYLEE